MSLNLTAINRRLNDFGLADTSQFFLNLEQEADDALLVVAVDTDAHQPMALHADFSLRLTVLCSRPMDVPPLLGRPGRFSVFSKGNLIPTHGLVSGVASAPAVGDHPAWTLTFSSPLSLLKRQRHNRVFVEQDALAIAQKVLKERLAELCTIDVQAATPPTQAQITQYHETDYDFLRRILAKEGITLHLVDGDDQATLVLIDDLSQSPVASDPAVLPFMTNAGNSKDQDHIAAVQQATNLQAERIHLGDHNSDLGSDLSATHRQATDGQAGSAELWGLNYSDSEQGTALANRLAEHSQWQNQCLRMHTTCRTLRPGSRFELTHHPERSGFYQVISVRLSGSQKSLAQGRSGKAFQCEVEAIPVSLHYRPTYQPLPARSALFTGRIHSEVDDQGRYRIQYPFDRRPEDNAEPSPATELLQPFGGANHGMHFPLEEGTEVAIGSINGDLDRPVILGALYNARSPNVVTADNARQNRIRTRAGHELLMHDQRGEEHIQLNTPDELNRLKLDATADQHQIELITEEGDMTLSAGQNVNMTVGKSMTVEVGEHHQVEVGGNQSLITDEGDIQLEAGGDLTQTAAGAVQWEAQDGDLDLHSGGDTHIHSEGQRFDQVADGNYQIEVAQGQYELAAAERVQWSSDDGIALHVGSSTLQLDSNFIVDSGQIELNADKIAIRAGKVGNN